MHQIAPQKVEKCSFQLSSGYKSHKFNGLFKLFLNFSSRDLVFLLPSHLMSFVVSNWKVYHPSETTQQ